ncbi:MAG: recombinase family protein [Acidobacteriaceae bacterium]
MEGQRASRELGMDIPFRRKAPDAEGSQAALADVAKIMEQFQQMQISLVSVTQRFNTTTSMDRLTLNVLLSFAQFEREVTGERIRDKTAASKRKGMCMGGIVLLGYDLRDRKLYVNESEALRVSIDLQPVPAARQRNNSQRVAPWKRHPQQEWESL